MARWIAARNQTSEGQEQHGQDAQVKLLGMAQDVPNDDNRHIRLVGRPVTLSRTPSKIVARPPEFGEQTDEVLTEFGFDREEIATLKAARVELQTNVREAR